VALTSRSSRTITYAPGGRLAVGPHIAGDGPAGHQKARLPLDWNVDVGERVHLLELAVFEQFEVVAREPPDEVALRIRDGNVHVNVVDADLEGGRWRRSRGCGVWADGPETLAASLTSAQAASSSLTQFPLPFLLSTFPFAFFSPCLDILRNDSSAGEKRTLAFGVVISSRRLLSIIDYRREQRRAHG
jgi:hypothetical protein